MYPYLDPMPARTWLIKHAVFQNSIGTTLILIFRGTVVLLNSSSPMQLLKHSMFVLDQHNNHAYVLRTSRALTKANAVQTKQYT